MISRKASRFSGGAGGGGGNGVAYERYFERYINGALSSGTHQIAIMPKAGIIKQIDAELLTISSGTFEFQVTVNSDTITTVTVDNTPGSAGGYPAKYASVYLPTTVAAGDSLGIYINEPATGAENLILRFLFE